MSFLCLNPMCRIFFQSGPLSFQERLTFAFLHCREGHPVSQLAIYQLLYRICTMRQPLCVCSCCSVQTSPSLSRTWDSRQSCLQSWSKTWPQRAWCHLYMGIWKRWTKQRQLFMRWIHQQHLHNRNEQVDLWQKIC